MRIRTVKPEFWTDSFMVSLPPIARLVFLSLISAADDHGYIVDDPEDLQLQLFPGENLDTFWGWVDFFLVSERLDMCYGEGEVYLQIRNWTKHQRVDRPSKSKIAREGSRVIAIPNEVRRALAKKYDCPPGESVTANCFHCGAEGDIHWWRNPRTGRPSGWVYFSCLEIDHLDTGVKSGSGEVNDLVLVCRHCNKSKQTPERFVRFLAALMKAADLINIGSFARTREDSPLDQGSGIRDQGSSRATSRLLI